VAAGAREGTLESVEHEDGQGNSELSGRVDATKEEAVGEGLSLEEQGESAREFVEGLVQLLELPGTVTMSVVDEGTVQIVVEGPELGILVGPGGGTLTAVQELARTVVQRRTGGRSERILVDVAGYRAKRAAALQRFTRQVAEEVVASLSERALEPMSASDRKVVHDTVNEIEGVVTRSVGEEPRRYIVVAPEPVQVQSLEAEDD
jgi:spoIIIJ-associated protein